MTQPGQYTRGSGLFLRGKRAVFTLTLKPFTQYYTIVLGAAARHARGADWGTARHPRPGSTAKHGTARSGSPHVTQDANTAHTAYVRIPYHHTSGRMLARGLPQGTRHGSPT